ncbi:E3 ubiquitin-protein ligase RNF103-like [Mercenaria mercenaria]|uniref:E3 ubiquitin-protein ligase RNF103-like n=1 Tax=Mercenaria mercenaria TaxID=6596 RepID=UPI00234F96A5|nr:E3 ubiquitin-protein ligase RNF103-like [Mercenaria mercenaria]
MAVWLKVTLLLIYLAVLFILARLLEAVAWYEQGQISRRLIDPMALSVLKLKALLEQRGVSYDNMVEKTELTELVEATGAVTDEEVQSTSVKGDEDMQITNYTSDIDFYEQVEDAKDSMWLVEIMTDNGRLLSDTSWHLVRNKVAKFGVRLGRFDCQQHTRLCTRKGWFTSRLVLALPENYRSKANVALYTYPGPVRTNSLFDWIKTKVNEQITVIEDAQTLQKDWLTFDSSLNPDVRVVFVSTLTSVPLFLSALSVKFPGRVKIGSIKMSSAKGKLIARKLDIKASPSYVVITRDRKYIYGQKSAEVMTFRSMEMFLKSVYPSINDIFIVSFICTNIASFFELSLTRGGFVKRLIKLALCVFKYNLILFLVWITVLALLQIPFFSRVSLAMLKGLRYCTLTPIFSYARKDILYYSSHKLGPMAVLTSMSLIVLFVKLKYFTRSDDVEEEEADWWNFSNLRTLNYHNGWEMMRLRPFDQIFNPSFGGPSITDDFEACQTVNSNDYIKLLPVWVFRDFDCICECMASKDEYVRHEIERTENFEQEKEGSYLQDNEMRFEDKRYRCNCGKNKRNPEANDNRSYFPSQTSSADLEGPSLGGTFDLPWDGLPKLKSKIKKVENLNRCQSKPPGYLEGTQCVICLEQFSSHTLLRGLPCRHVFHDKCILTWLLREHHFCPVCRWPSFQSKDQDFVNDLHSE